MRGAMQDQPLLISTLIEHAARHHRDTQIVSRRVEGDLHRYSYAEAAARARRVANTLDALGIAGFERVGTLAWNGYRHFELYYGVSGSGRVLHTINPRLNPDQVAWIINDADDRVLCFDLTFAPIVRAIQARCPGVRHWVALCDADRLPADAGIEGLVSYERWIASATDRYDWPTLDERSAATLCYTSGTTGAPKGVLYSHRSTLLHAWGGALPDSFGLSARSCVLPVVPMFHVNAWGIPYAAPLVGAKLVFPGAALDGRSLYELMEAEQVTQSAGVPTVWLGLLQHVQGSGARFSTMRQTMIGGSACPPAMIRSFHELGVEVRHGWGMTEMSPLGTVSTPKLAQAQWPEEAQLALRAKQGRALFGVAMRIVDPEGRELPWDGQSAGDLHVRGPWIVSGYFKDAGGSPLVDGWFPTGDVATIDTDGYLQITDRSKDVIKSGGEWISSIEIENIAMSHPAVALAACIGIPHPKWDERPLLVVVLKPGQAVTRDALLAHFDGRVASWQVPDDVVFVEQLPLGATGKVQKNVLRERYREHRAP
jgi:3-(methylthio)propionyl---CoA ligase